MRASQDMQPGHSGGSDEDDDRRRMTSGPMDSTKITLNGQRRDARVFLWFWTSAWLTLAALFCPLLQPYFQLNVLRTSYCV